MESRGECKQRRERKEANRGYTPSYIANKSPPTPLSTGRYDGGRKVVVGSFMEWPKSHLPSSFGGAPADVVSLHPSRPVSWTSSVIFSSCCFDSIRKRVCKQVKDPTLSCLSPSPSLLTLLRTHQLASGGRPCTHQAAGLGDKEWPVGQHWLGAGGEGGGTAERSEWSGRRSRTRVRLHDQCSPQICRRPHHIGTVSRQEGRVCCQNHRAIFGSWSRYLLSHRPDTRHGAHCAWDMMHRSSYLLVTKTQQERLGTPAPWAKTQKLMK